VSAGALAGDLARAAVRVAAGLMVGALATTAAIGLVSLIFSGDLAAYRQQGIGLALFAAAALGVASAWGLSYRGAICHPQDATTVALAVAAAAIAARFHNSLVRLLAGACNLIRERTGLNLVALSGGVMQNALLFTRLQRTLAARGFEVLTHTLTPPNDGSIALGQVAVAAARMEREG